MKPILAQLTPLALIASLALVACGTPTGSERGACFGNGTCNAGLTCVSNICVRDTTSGDARSGDATDIASQDGDRTDVPRADAADAITNDDLVGDASMDSTPPDDATDATSDVATVDVTADDATTTDTGDDTTAVDTGVDTPAVDVPIDSPVTTDSGGGCTAAGVECTNYAATLAAAPRGATSLANCVVQLHQTDCCGAQRAYGINHGARTTLCPAETACVSMYPTPAACSDSTITTDTGETTTNMADVKVRIVSPTPCSFDMTQTCYTCETFVCTTGSCRTAPGISGGCGP